MNGAWPFAHRLGGTRNTGREQREETGKIEEIQAFLFTPFFLLSRYQFSIFDNKLESVNITNWYLILYAIC